MDRYNCNMKTLQLERDSIMLAQAVKAAGLAGSGGQAKHLVRSGAVMVNDTIETQPGRKLLAGDRFAVDGVAWTVTAPA